MELQQAHTATEMHLLNYYKATPVNPGGCVLGVHPLLQGVKNQCGGCADLWSPLWQEGTWSIRLALPNPSQLKVNRWAASNGLKC